MQTGTDLQPQLCKICLSSTNSTSWRPGKAVEQTIPHSKVELWLVALAIASGIVLRAAYLDAKAFWVDEAESAINALTILRKGYPTDTYLGLPIYENTLVWLWPGHPEYEFRDISYSDKHMAVYHGWLPLYCIAASFALHHIRPDEPAAPLQVKHDEKERRHRTLAGRVPAVLFGALFLVFAFFGGKVLYGRDAGWAALLVGTIHTWHIEVCRQARYYSATIALSTGCCLLLWVMIDKGKWKHFLSGALLFVLLFHTHLLTFFSAFVVFALALPFMIRRHQFGALKAAVFGLIVAAGSVPWILMTGFYKHQARIPCGWSLLSLPADLIQFPPAVPSHLIVGAVLFVAWVILVSPRLFIRLRPPLFDSCPPLLFLSLWIVCSYVSFLLFMPAASFTLERLNLSYWGPTLLLAAILCASIARIVAGRFSILAAPAMFLLLLFLTGHRIEPTARYSTGDWSSVEALFNQLKSMDLRRDTKLYASPNDHLILTFYTGLPFQSIAPVRKSFLDRYEGDVVLVESGGFSKRDGFLAPEELQKTAFRADQCLSRGEAEHLSALLRTRDYRETVNRNVTGTLVQLPEQVPPFAEELLQRNRAEERAGWRSWMGRQVMIRGLNGAGWCDWRDIFFYRFSDPDSRRGPKLNYAERLRGASALLLTDSAQAIYYSRGGSRQNTGGVNFTIMR